MPLKTPKEKRYKDLADAVEGGELKMFKFLWNLIDEIDKLVEETPQGQIERRAKEVDAILQKLKENPPKDGKTPTKSELISIMIPLIPRSQPGKDGKTPTKQDLLALIEPLLPDAIPGLPGRKGDPGKQGKMGPMPRHEWNGTFIRFELPDGDWGEWKNLQGGGSGGPIEYGPRQGFSTSPMTVKHSGGRIEGVTELVLGGSLTATKTVNGVRIDANGELNITYSDTAPVAPEDGDLWVDTSVLFDLPVTSPDILSIVALTQAEYDALTPVATTLYVITD